MCRCLTVEVILGSLTFTGSLMAAGKLQEILPQRPITYKGQNTSTSSLLALAIGIGAFCWSRTRPGAALSRDHRHLRWSSACC